MKTSILFWVLLFLTFVKINAIDTNKVTISQPDKAYDYFLKSEYQKSMEIYSELLADYPKDPEYNYYAGICMLQLNKNLSLAIKYLRFASVRSVPSDVYFYLARAYHLNEQYDLAISYYDSFMKFAGKAEIRNSNTDYHRQQAVNGKKLIASEKNVYKPFYSEKISSKEIHQHLNQLNNNQIQFQTTPFQLYEDYDLLTDSGLVVWFPANLEPGQSVYLPARLNGRRSNMDIVTLQKKDVVNFTAPVELDLIINSTLDEQFAWYDKNSDQLIFSSNGHNSIGGFDIFISKFDPTKKSWSIPKNAGTGINSPFDELIAVGSDRMMIVISNQYPGVDSVEALSFRTEYKFTDLEWNIHQDIEPASKQKIPIDQPNKLEKPEIKPEKTITYDDWISMALDYQFRSDSVNLRIEDIRKDIKTTNDTETRNGYFSEIKKNEIIAEELKLKADEMFLKAREWENIHMDQEFPAPEFKVVEKAITEPKKNSKEQDLTPPIEGNSSDYEPFRIQTKSPYSSSNPIKLKDFEPNDLVYQIQLGVYSKIVENDFFGGISPIYGIELTSRSLYKYYAGRFKRYEQAYKALNEIREYGYKDAFIVSTFRGKIISINRAQEIENEIYKN